MIDLTKIKTPYGLLDAETQEALEAHGGPYEFFGYLGWREADDIKKNGWCPEFAYRVKPQPRKPLEGWGVKDTNGRLSGYLYKDRATADYCCGYSQRVVRLIEWPENASLPTWPEGEE